jgi:hypothetical protein
VTETALCLLVLLAGPLSGLAGRAEASFVLRKPAQESEVDNLTLWLDAPARFDSPGGFDTPNTPPAQSAERPAAPERDDTPLPSGPCLPTLFSPAYPDLQHGGMSSPDHSSSGPQVGTGLALMLTSSGAAHPTEGNGQLFLADDRSQPPTFPSRLFRPPRGSVA